MFEMGEVVYGEEGREGMSIGLPIVMWYLHPFLLVNTCEVVNQNNSNTRTTLL